MATAGRLGNYPSLVHTGRVAIAGRLFAAQFGLPRRISLLLQDGTVMHAHGARRLLADMILSTPVHLITINAAPLGAAIVGPELTVLDAHANNFPTSPLADYATGDGNVLA